MFQALESIMGLKEKIQEISESLQKLIQVYDRIVNLFSIFFTIIPPSVIIFFLICVLILILLNSLSPSTPRINLSLGVLLVSIAWGSINKILFQELYLFLIIKTSLYVLLPLWGYTFLKALISYTKRKFFLKKISHMDFEISVEELQLQYHEFINNYYSGKKTGEMDAAKNSLNKLSELILAISKREKE